MTKAERTKPNFLKPRNKMFDKQTYKQVSKAKVFGITASDGSSMVCPSPLYPTSKAWAKLLRDRGAPFLQAPRNNW